MAPDFDLSRAIAEMRIESRSKRNRTKANYRPKKITDLGDNCLVQVFRYLPPKSQLRAQRVNRRWAKLSSESWACKANKSLVLSEFLGQRCSAEDTSRVAGLLLGLWGPHLACLKLLVNGIAHRADLLHAVAAHCPQLRRLHLSGLKSSEGEALEALARQCGKIEWLDVADLPGGFEHELALFLSESKSLTRLRVARASRFTGLCLASVASDRFEFLAVSCCPDFELRYLKEAKCVARMRGIDLDAAGSCLEEDLACILESGESLVDLRLKRAPGFTGGSLARAKSKRFRTLVVDSCEMFEPRHLTHVQSLRSFVLCGREFSVANSNLNYIGALRNLKLVVPQSATARDWNNVSLLFHPDAFDALTNLAYLDLNVREFGLDDDFLRKIGQRCRSLQHLFVFLSSRATGDGLRSVLDLPLLERLHLKHRNVDVKLDAWSTWRREMPNLKYLGLLHVLIDDQDVANLVKLSPKLANIRIDKHLDANDPFIFSEQCVDALKKTVRARRRKTGLKIQVNTSKFNVFYLI